ncbi:MAG TPA: methyltransferase domain-containing protein [Dehalococcoidia bacterium]|nr:methyltransferase domain-containing protein [Dehalococcoidia bacterium]
MVTPAEFALFPELRDHFNAVYDLLVGDEGPRGATPLLDVGTGTGAGLAATVSGTDLFGVAIDLRFPAEWLGPPDYAFLIADAQTLPFATDAFPAVLQMETSEWLTDPVAALREAVRVSQRRVVVVHTDWQSLWFDSGDPETSQEFTRLFAGPRSDHSAGIMLESQLEAAGLPSFRHDVHVIRGVQIAPDTYAKHLLGLLREWLCNQIGAVRARRFDEWLKDLEERSREGTFGFSVDRHVLTGSR